MSSKLSAQASPSPMAGGADLISPMKSVFSEQIIFQGVDLQVIDYYYITDGSSYDKHYFIIEVFVEDIKYTVDRSYVDFVELDRRLRKVYPETSMPDLPLRGAASIEQAIIKEAASLQDQKKKPLGSGSLTSTRNSTVYTRDSLISSPNFKSKRQAQQFIIPDNSTEVIKNCKNALTLYLVGLTCHHELLTSEAMAMFLDEEITSMFLANLPPPLTTFDLVLINMPAHNCIVSRIEEHSFVVPSNYMLVWRFNTAHFDIGFQVEVNGKIRLPLTRYRASEASICGAIEVTVDSNVILRWNNTYAKLHSKNLTWSTRIVSKSDFDIAKEQTMAVQRETRQFEIQRNALKRAVNRHAQRLSGVVHGSIIEAEYEEEEMGSIKKWKFKVDELISSNDIANTELEKAEIQIRNLLVEKESLLESKAVIAESWEFAEAQVEEAKQEISLLDNKLLELEETIQIKEEEIGSLHELQHDLMEEHNMVRENLTRLLISLNQAVSACKGDHLRGIDCIQTREAEFKNLMLQASLAPGGSLSVTARKEHDEKMRFLITSMLADMGSTTKTINQNCTVLSQIQDGVHQMVIQSAALGEKGSGDNNSTANSGELTDF